MLISSPGIQGDLQFGRADIAWGNLIVDRSRLSFMGFSTWHTLDSFCVLVPKQKDYPKIIALVLPFDKYVWIGVIISIAMFICALAIYAAVHEQK
jgi:hypothetical protein